MPDNTYHRDQVVSIINSVISKVNQPREDTRDMICDELYTLKNIMEELRQNLGGAVPADLRQTHIPSANDELDAVVSATEAASGAIMDSCDHILSTLEHGGEAMDNDIRKHVTAIYESCTFQDITGQRISKVIRTLKIIDTKVSDLLGALESFGADIPGTSSSVSPDERSGLLNGPGLPGAALSQDEIDRLLGGI